VLLHRDGFGAPDKPDDGVPRLPDDLGDTSDSALMELFRSLTAWAGYMGFRLAAAEVDEEQYEAELRMTTSQSLLQHDLGGRDTKVTIAKAQVDVEPEVAKKRQALLTARAYRKMLQRLFENVERSIFLVSRELTRRTSGTDRRVGP
jgi:hypothetical protein